jgi:hypothetical protein
MVKYRTFEVRLENFEEIAEELEPITLDEMDRVALLNRTDTKFYFSSEHLPGILREIKDDYKILSVDGVRLNSYRTLYYDTPELKLYHMHQNGKKNRVKVRNRKYIESDLCFLEVKLKNNRGRTIKERVVIDDFEEEIEKGSQEFIDNRADFDGDLHPMLWNEFHRITLVSKTTPERMTFDLGLTFEVDGKHRRMNKLVIAELKQEKVNRHSKAFAAFKKRLIRPERISKYCIGIAMLKDGVKKNTFKHKLLKIDKIENRAA